MGQEEPDELPLEEGGHGPTRPDTARDGSERAESETEQGSAPAASQADPQPGSAESGADPDPGAAEPDPEPGSAESEADPEPESAESGADPEPEQSDEPDTESWFRSRWGRVAIVAGLVPVAFYVLCIVGLVYARFLPPLATGVQLQRTVERVVAGESPVRDYRWRPIDEISRYFPQAVVAAEDARFYRHAGFDWEELRRAREEAERRDAAMRGASTLTHQLIKNLFFTTHRNPVRKLYEWGLTLPAEWILGKDRIVELYVNVVELGPGTFGAEAAAQHYFGVSADRLTRHQAASLAAILPAPLRRHPAAMTRYTAIIEERMSRLGW